MTLVKFDLKMRLICLYPFTVRLNLILFDYLKLIKPINYQVVSLLLVLCILLLVYFINSLSLVKFDLKKRLERLHPFTVRHSLILLDYLKLIKLLG